MKLRVLQVDPNVALKKAAIRIAPEGCRMSSVFYIDYGKIQQPDNKILHINSLLQRTGNEKERWIMSSILDKTLFPLPVC